MTTARQSQALRSTFRQTPPTPPARDVWGVFMRLLAGLGGPVSATGQVRQTLEAVRDALEADAVCWHDETTGETLTPPGEQALIPEECDELALRLLAARRGDTGRIIWRAPNAAPGEPST